MRKHAMASEPKAPVTASGRLETCFRQLAGDGLPLALATVVQTANSTSGKAGSRALVGADGIVEGWIGGGCAQPAVIEAARMALDSGQPCLIRVGPKGEWETLDGIVDFSSGCLSGGTQVIFVEPLLPQARLCILGDSPVALHLCELAARLDFTVTLVSPDVDASAVPNGVGLERDFAAAGGDYAVVATQGRHDRAALKAALQSSAGYVGMVASRRKIAGLEQGLLKSGVDADRVAQVRSPVGVDIGALTPAEIALSILAELVRERRGRRPEELLSKPVAASVDVNEAPQSNHGGCCGGE